MFPLGDSRKADTRKKAEDFGLHVKDKSESNEICFISGDYRQFLVNMMPDYKPVKGYFVDTDGNILGKHDGIFSYTVGQRRGLGISAKEPYYVSKIDIENNRITLCRKEELCSKELLVERINLVTGSGLSVGSEVDIQIRYRHKPIKGVVASMKDGTLRFNIDLSNDAPTKGQAAVFYDDEEVIGGGWIA